MRFKKKGQLYYKMRCPQCKKKAGIMTLDCKYCQTSFCTSCIALEKHECKGMDIYKNENKQLLNDTLKSAMYSKAEKFNVD